MTRCSVCSAEASKYKCVTCKAQSCSLPCFKNHAAQCTADSPDRRSNLTDSTVTKAEATEMKSPEERSHYPSVEELDALFRTYPTLKSQLQDIYKTTQSPAETGEDKNSFHSGFNARSRGRGSQAFNSTGSARNWTPDKGLDRGLKQLQTQLEQNTNRSEALRVFVDTILRTNGHHRGA